MPIDYPAVLALRADGHRASYCDRDTILYALGIGVGGDPLNAAERPFIYEKELRAVPSLATVLSWGMGLTTEQLGVNYRFVLHGEEEIIVHRPLAAAAEIIVDSSISQVYDKGTDKGAVIVRHMLIRSALTDEPLCTVNRTIFARDDGGCGGSPDPAPAPHCVPERAPDRSVMLATRHDQAALFRLCGDRNPLHIDPDVARAAGFERPILHGLCTYGLTCRAVLQTMCDYDPARIASHAARFSAPVYPGETVKVDLWRDGDIVSFEASVPARDVMVIRNGKTRLRSAAAVQRTGGGDRMVAPSEVTE